MAEMLKIHLNRLQDQRMYDCILTSQWLQFQIFAHVKYFIVL